MKRSWRCLALVAAAIVGLFPAAFSQVTTGTPSFGTFAGGPDVIDLANLNGHLTIPIRMKAGRGTNFEYALTYDTSIWTPNGSSGVQTWTPDPNYGWHGQASALTGYVTYGSLWIAGSSCFMHYNFVYHDPQGTGHSFDWHTFQIFEPRCHGGATSSGPFTSDDGTYSIFASNTDSSVSASIYPTSGGGYINPPMQDPNATGTYWIEDTNGNLITTSNNGTSNTFTDTLGTTALYVTHPDSMTDAYSYLAPNGNWVSFKVNYTMQWVATNFQVPNISEFPPQQVRLVSSIVLPDDTATHPSRYTFNYELTPTLASCSGVTCVTGRLQSATFPTGGTITYTYTADSNGKLILADGSAAGLTRQTPDGTWTYKRTGNVLTDTILRTTITDPTTDQNETVYDFSGIYLTQKQVCQTPALTCVLLETEKHCYNGNWTNCETTAVTAPITFEATFTTMGGHWKQQNITYNANGLVTEIDDSEWTTGSGPPATLRKVLTTYNTSLSNNIVDRPSNVSVKDGSNTLLASTNYSYDESNGPAYCCYATSNTPQHWAISGSRGLPTTIQSWTGLTNLTRNFSYLDTGGVYSTKDVNGGVTSNVFNDATSTCGNAFPNAVSYPIANFYTWNYWDGPNCLGAVATMTRDPNYQPTSYSWTDGYYWRPAQITDPTGFSSYTNYSTPSQGYTSTFSEFNNNNSTTDHFTQRDSLGRTRFSQRRQGPWQTTSSFDSVETDYDSLGRVFRVTTPYAGTGSQTWCAANNLPSNCTPQGTTTTYDALNRPKQVKRVDGSGNSFLLADYTYNDNDVLITEYASSGDSNRQKQYEYDGLGRLTSVCEVTSGAGSGTCGQSNPLTGYLTKYTYDALGNLTGVIQNAQAPAAQQQTRSFQYDGLSRLVWEQEPENGWTHRIYDSDTSANPLCPASGGDLVRREDQAGNVTCFAYDAMHRMTATTYPSGPNATPSKYFVYDSATVNGQTMQNTQGRLARAYTCTTCGPNPPLQTITDLGFSYSARGEVIDVYESTPHAGGYYHVGASYWPHGALQNWTMPGVPMITYGASDGSGLDGEGRITKVMAANGQNPITGVSYVSSGTTQPIGALTDITLGSADADHFDYDPNTGRLTKYTFKVGSPIQTEFGQLTWNANGNLSRLQITDGLSGSLDTQTCSYAHDDLGRVASVDCGSKWYQSFSYDPFGNAKKAVQQPTPGTPFQPTYDTTNNTNRVSSLPNGSVAYDSNGDITTFTDPYGVAHTYTWDAEGNMLSHSSQGSTVNLTYDALGSMVEQVPSTDPNCTTPSDCTQIVYGPDDSKLALMHGQTLVKAFIPLPGGATAVYNSSGLAYYRHSDHLGSSRLASTPSRCVYYSGAYAPFGESYAEYVNTACGGQTDRSFTGQNEDTVPGMADFLNREYSSAQQGRWLSPDPMGMDAADLSDPQSWNQYAYVNNVPLTTIDPSGFGPELPSGQPWFVFIWNFLPYFIGHGTVAPELGTDAEGGGDLGGGGGWGETLGLPAGVPLPHVSPWGWPGGSQCDFGLCDPISNPFAGPQPDACTCPFPLPNGNPPRIGPIIPPFVPVSLGLLQWIIEHSRTVPLAERDPRRLFPPSDRETLRDRANGRCEVCGRKTTPSEKSEAGKSPSPREGQAGHRKAWARGGRTTLKNGKWVCRECNLKEGVKSK